MDTIKLANKNDCRMIAHRGVSGIERENTCAAFVAAGNRSYFGIETDVYLTKDGQFAISHDASLLRVSGVDMPLEGSTLAELQSVQILDRDGSPRSDLRVPTLADYISICRKYEKEAILELKSSFTDEQVGRMLDIIRGLGWMERTTFISFKKDNLLALRRVDPTAKAQFLPPENAEWVLQFVLENHIDLDIYHQALTPEIVKMIHDAGLKVNCWTVDTVEAAERVLAMGVDYITSNILE